MTTMVSPAVRRRRVANELRALREAAGLNLIQMARKLGWSKSKVSRLETDYSVPNATQVTQFLRALRVDDDTWQHILQMTHESAERGWWIDFGRYIGDRQKVNASLEWGAETVTEYTTSFVPGLLQSIEYLKARHGNSIDRGEFTSSDDLHRIVEARLTRQRMVRRSGGPRYEAILDELAVRRPAASRAVMYRQVRELIRLQTKEPQITIRVLPIEAEVDGYWLPNNAFSRYTYRDPGDPTMVVAEGEATDSVLSAPEQVQTYEMIIDRLRKAALPPADSIELLRAVADKLKTIDEKG